MGLPFGKYKTKTVRRQIRMEKDLLPSAGKGSTGVISKARSPGKKEHGLPAPGFCVQFILNTRG